MKGIRLSLAEMLARKYSVVMGGGATVRLAPEESEIPGGRIRIGQMARAPVWSGYEGLIHISLIVWPC